MPDVADEELNAPAPEPLRFDIDEPELLDDDMVEILVLPEASALQIVSTHLQLSLPRPPKECTRHALANWKPARSSCRIRAVSTMQAWFKTSASSWPVALSSMAHGPALKVTERHVQIQEEQDAPTMVHNGGGSDASGEVTAVDETTMEDGDLEDAVGLLTQLEVPHPPHKLLNAAASTIWHP